MNDKHEQAQPPHAGPTPPEPIKSFFEIVNQHDTQGFLAAFTVEASVDDWGRVFTGLEAIERWSEREFIGSHGVLRITDVVTIGAEITVVGDWRSTHANGMSRFTFALVGGKINKMTIREG